MHSILAVLFVAEHGHGNLTHHFLVLQNQLGELFFRHMLTSLIHLERNYCVNTLAYYSLRFIVDDRFKGSYATIDKILS